MPGGNVDLVLIVANRGAGKTEFAVPLFLQSTSGVWLDMGVASDYFKYKKDNRLQLSIPRAVNLKDALFYISKLNPSHFSFRPQSEDEAKLFISEFSKGAKGKTLFIDDAQKLLSYYDSNSEYKDFLSDGRMQEQNLILCCHFISEVTVKTRRESNVLIHMGPLQRPKDIKAFYEEWQPSNMEERPSMDTLYEEMVKTPQYTPFYIKNK